MPGRAVLIHSYQSQTVRGFNQTTPEYRTALMGSLRAMQAVDGKGLDRPSPQIVRYCESVLEPYVATYRRSRRNWEALRAYEADEGSYRRGYVEGMGVESFKARIAKAWAA